MNTVSAKSQSISVFSIAVCWRQRIKTLLLLTF